ncbi:MAG: hypothetical protein HY245_13135 [Rhizobiales bacterium]|nr:hypothetical protein [Hyphomicrobiales bacterium]MBI3674334.1 hypothetical protein [Hyphomicrobiales bacterium]
MTFAGAALNFLDRATRFLRNTAGNVTIITGIASIPVIAAAGMAVDYARISRVKDQVQIVADGASLASASAKYISGTTEQKQAKRVQIATSYLAKGLAALTDADIIGAPTVTATGSTVSVKVKAKVKASLINVLDTGKQDALIGGEGGGAQAGKTAGRSYNLVISSKARWNEGLNYVCLLALNENVSQALELKGTADIIAKNCSVWDNSSHSSGLYQNGNATLTALTICTVADNYYGSNYTPTPKTGCDVFKDPLKNGFATDFAATYTNGSPVARYTSNKSQPQARMNFTLPNNTMQPGVYTGGVQVGQNINVTMQPGVYFIKDGPFVILPGGTVTGTGVTIVLMGNSNAYLDVQAGGNLNLTAPASGNFKSIAIAQHPATIPTVAKGNSVIGGGSIEVTGLMYFPTQPLLITGNGDVSVNSKYFAIVADTIAIEGNGQLNVGTAANSDETGQPALPSSGQGVTFVTLE